MNVYVAGAVSLASAALGAAAGFYLAKRQLEQRYQERLEQEIEATKEFYRLLNKGDGFSTPEEAARTLGRGEVLPSNELRRAAEAMVGYKQQRSFEGREVVVTQSNIFAKNGVPDDDMVPEELLRNRTEEAPYVISNLEFAENDLHYDQVTYTYYEVDNILADEAEETIDDLDEAVGEANMKLFGHYSKDPNVVYIRNDARTLDIQVLRNTGSYSEQVAGLGE